MHPESFHTGDLHPATLETTTVSCSPFVPLEEVDPRKLCSLERPKNLVIPVQWDAIYRVVQQLGSTLKTRESTSTLSISHDKEDCIETQVSSYIKIICNYKIHKVLGSARI